MILACIWNQLRRTPEPIQTHPGTNLDAPGANLDALLLVVRLSWFRCPGAR